MPGLALLSAVFTVGVEQTVQWKYGVSGIIGLLLLTVGIKAKAGDTFLDHVRAATRTTELASWIAGRRRGYLQEEWAAILAGDPENGVLLGPFRKMGYALGFVRAALIFRLSDLAIPLWLMVDWVLSVQSRTNTFIALTAGAAVLYIADTYGSVTAIWCSVYCWIMLHVIVGLLRRIRGIEPTSTSKSRGKE